jgi:hypothetical protein
MDLALRPMSTSQVLDRTFYLYRNHFVLFAGIAIITPAMKLIALLVQLKIFGPMVMPQQPDAFTPQFLQAMFVRIIISVVIGTIVYLIGTALASSATAYAVSMVHLGKSTTIAEAYGQADFLPDSLAALQGCSAYSWTVVSFLCAFSWSRLYFCNDGKRRRCPNRGGAGHVGHRFTRFSWNYGLPGLDALCSLPLRACSTSMHARATAGQKFHDSKQVPYERSQVEYFGHSSSYSTTGLCCDLCPASACASHERLTRHECPVPSNHGNYSLDLYC